MPAKIPMGEVLNLSKQGYTDADIIQYLREEGYSATAINDAMNQAKIKMELAKTAGMDVPEYAEPAEEAELPEVQVQAEIPVMPSPSASENYPYSYPHAESSQAPSAEAMEEIAEEIISEKWQEFKAKAGNITELKVYIESRLKNLEERMKRLESVFDKIQSTTLTRVQEYGRDVKSLGTEMHALEGAFSKILQPLVGSVKELREVSAEMKKIKPKTSRGVKKTLRPKLRKKVKKKL